MAGVVEGFDADESAVLDGEAGDAAVGGGEPDGFQVGRVEGAHEVEGEDADCSGVTKDCDLAAAICSDDLVQFLPGAVQELAVTLAAGEYVVEVASQQGCVLFRMLLGRVFESKTFHHANTALAKGVSTMDLQSSEFRKRPRGFHCSCEIARVDRR